MTNSSPQVSEAKGPCDICGKPFKAHNMGHGYPMCGIYAVYRQSARTPTETAWDQPESRVSEEAVPSGKDMSDEVARCIEIAREVQAAFRSDEYATGQPLSSLQERFACGQVIIAIEKEFGHRISGEGVE